MSESESDLKTFQQLIEGTRMKRANANFVDRWLFRHSFGGYSLYSYAHFKQNIFKEVTRVTKSTVRRYLQRGKRGYADSDIWNLDFFILSWLPEALDQLADTTFSFPGPPWTHESWKTFLKHHAAVMRAVRQREQDLEDTNVDWDEFKKSWRAIGEMFPHLWD